MVATVYSTAPCRGSGWATTVRQGSAMHRRSAVLPLSQPLPTARCCCCVAAAQRSIKAHRPQERQCQQMQNNTGVEPVQPCLMNVLEVAVAALFLFGTILPPMALAAEGEALYNPASGSETLKTILGVAYIAGVIIFFVRLFQRRAQKATSERVASVADAAAYSGGTGSDDEEEEEEVKAKQQEVAKVVTPLQSFVGAAQAGIICYLLFQTSIAVDAFFKSQTLPDQATQYTAHNVAVLVQTVCRGLVYLITFIFGANAVGLTGLTIQLLLFPDFGQEEGGSRARAAPLPKVSVTDDVFALRRAFQEAERMGQQQAQKDIQRSQQMQPGDESD